jgi:8-oxo-dGTP diphosphatase
MRKMQSGDSIKPLVVLVACLIERNGKYLIAQKASDDLTAPNKWATIGGKIESFGGEIKNIIQKTLKREVREEVGIEIEDEIKLFGNKYFIRPDGHPALALFFLAKWKSGEPKPLTETQAVKWVTPKEFDDYRKDPWMRGVFAMLGGYLKRIGF